MERQPYTVKEVVAIAVIFTVMIAYSWGRHFVFVRTGDGIWRLGLFKHSWFYYAEPFLLLAAYGVFVVGRAWFRRHRD